MDYPLHQKIITPPQKVIGRVKGMGGKKVAASAVGTINGCLTTMTALRIAALYPLCIKLH